MTPHDPTSSEGSPAEQPPRAEESASTASARIECVPNFSEGRDTAVLDRIADAIGATSGIILLDRTHDVDHNRSVFTFVGCPDEIEQALAKAAAVAVKSIDLRRHTGVHPRIGAIDVIPFVPLEGTPREECVGLAERLARLLWERFEIPSYFYGEAARSEERRGLENIRRGGFEGLSAALPGDTERRPDTGGPGLHPSAGATAIGVRKFLIAFNINLATGNVAIARQIAKTIRESSGGLPAVKALGLALPSRGLAQVSMNLTDFERTSLYEVYGWAKHEAERLGTHVAGSEIIGLVPQRAIEMAAERFLQIEDFEPGTVFENRLRQASNKSEPRA
jgi:glutamate formiminotransferase